MSANHDDFAALAHGYALGTLTEEEARSFAAHLSTCEECRQSVRDVAAIGEALARALPQQTPPPGLRERVLTRAVAPAVVERHVPSATISRSGPRYGWLAAAAALVAAVTSVMAWQYREEAARARTGQQEATRQLRSLEQQIAQLQAGVSTAAQTRSVLAARDMSRIELAGQAPAPGATGRVFWSPTHGLVFAATNLPELPPGRVYQLWVVADAPISAGIGRLTGGGEISVVSTPTAPARPKAFALTIEPEGGSPAPTSPLFLLGSY
jgi:anti-sigma-K factor RskA